MFAMDDTRPIFLQIAERIEDDIINGNLPEETQIPSANQFAALYRINPATAAKGVSLLAEEGILYKKRGIGMFVRSGARERLKEKRKEKFYGQYVAPAIREARKLGITADELAAMIRREAEDE